MQLRSRVLFGSYGLAQGVLTLTETSVMQTTTPKPQPENPEASNSNLNPETLNLKA